MSKPPSGRPAGRPIGALSKIAAEARELAKESGLLPHEILLAMARGVPQEQAIVNASTGKITGKTWIVPDMDQRKDAAKASAPYFAPRISTVEVIAGISDADLDLAIARIAAEAGLSFIADGEESQDEEDEAPRGRRIADDD